MDSTVDDEDISKLIARQLGVSRELVLDSVKFRGLGADSIDLLCLIMRLEQALDIRISEQEAETCLTVGAALCLVRRKLSSVSLSHALPASAS